MGTDEVEARRLPLPDELNVNTLRTCVDSALRVIGEDAGVKFGPAMHRAYGSDWTHVAGPRNRDVGAVDPVFWLQELQNPGSAARANPALQNLPDTFRRRLHQGAAARNAHCHYAAGADDPAVVLERLRALSAAATELRLPCASEIRATADHIARLHSGAVPASPSLSESVALAAENTRLLDALAAAEVKAAERAEKADLADDLVLALEEQAAETQAARNEAAHARIELAEARAEAERRRQEAEIAEQYRLDLVAYQSDVEAAQSGVELPPTVGEVFAHIYAAGVGVNRLFADIAQAEQLKFGDGRDASEATANQIRRMAEMYEALGVSRTHVEGLPAPAELDVTWVTDHVDAAELLIGTRAWQAELAALDEESRNILTSLSSSGEEYRLLAELVGGKLSVTARDAPASSSDSGARQIDDGTQIVPGETWPYERGDQTWVLSAQRRSLRLARNGPRLADQVGEATEKAVVDAFLALRPEGGRVFVDGDGDASTFSDGTLIYLGQLPT